MADPIELFQAPIGQWICIRGGLVTRWSQSRPWITRHRLDGARKSWNDKSGWAEATVRLLAWLRPAGQISELGSWPSPNASSCTCSVLTASIPTRELSGDEKKIPAQLRGTDNGCLPQKPLERSTAGYRALDSHQQGAVWVLHNPAFWWRTPGSSALSRGRRCRESGLQQLACSGSHLPTLNHEVTTSFPSQGLFSSGELGQRYMK